MREFFLSDEVNRMHVAILRSVLAISLLLPICHSTIALLHLGDDSTQIFVGFIAITIIATMMLLSFISAVRMTVWKVKFDVKPKDLLVIKTYRHIPILYFVTIISIGVLEHM